MLRSPLKTTTLCPCLLHFYNNQIPTCELCRGFNCSCRKYSRLHFLWTGTSLIHKHRPYPRCFSARWVMQRSSGVLWILLWPHSQLSNRQKQRSVKTASRQWWKSTLKQIKTRRKEQLAGSQWIAVVREFYWLKEQDKQDHRFSLWATMAGEKKTYILSMIHIKWRTKYQHLCCSALNGWDTRLTSWWHIHFGILSTICGS